MTQRSLAAEELRPPGYRSVGWMVVACLCLFPLYLFLTGRRREGWWFLGGVIGSSVALLVGEVMYEMGGGTSAIGVGLLIPASLVSFGLSLWTIVETFQSPRKTREYNERLLAE